MSEFVNSRNTPPAVYCQYLIRGINTLPAGNVLVLSPKMFEVFKVLSLGTDEKHGF